MPIMPILPNFPSSLLLAAAIFLTACSPTFDWREVRGPDASYTVLLPAKPATVSREINLDGTPVNMTMTAAETEGITFAVGTAKMADAAAAGKAVTAMKTALVKNINGTVRQEKPLANGMYIEAAGPAAAGGEPRLLYARFLSKDNRIFQVVMTGKEASMSRDAAEMFFGSFKN